MSSPLQTLFAEHDLDSDGVLDKAEWTAFVLDLLSPNSPLTQVGLLTTNGIY